jgi:hypothetical protein
MNDEDQILAEFKKELDSGFEIVLAWSPRHSPVVISFLIVNEQKVAGPILDTISPFIAVKVPMPDKDGNLKIEWGIAPEVGVEEMTFAIRRRDASGLQVFARSPAVARGNVWYEAGVTIHAP